MVSMKNSLAGLALGLGVAALATPGFGQNQSRANQTTAAREAAIHECSVRASKFQDASDQTAHPASQLNTVSPWSPSERVYGTCMAEHNQHLLD